MNSSLTSIFSEFDPSNLDYVKKIGHGSCSTVWKVQDKDSNTFYSLKIIQMQKLQKTLPNFTSTLKQIQSFSHSNLLKHFHSYSDTQNFYQINELFEGMTLLEKLFKAQSFTEPEAFHYFSQIVEAAEYLEARGLTHGDIKIENVLIGKSESLKVTFLGCGNFITKEQTELSKDIWSLGVVLYELLVGCHTLEFSKRIKYFENFCVDNIARDLSLECKDLLLMLICKSSGTSFESIRNHPWVLARGQCVVVESKGWKVGSEQGRESVFSTNFTELPQTRESCLDQIDLLEAEKEKLFLIEYKIQTLRNEIEERSRSESFLLSQIENSDSELNHLILIDTSQELVNKLSIAQKELMEKTQTWRRLKIYFGKLKSLNESKTKEAEEKELELKELFESVKNLNMGISKIKSHRSLDLSSLRINLDVLQHKIGERSGRSPMNSGVSLVDLKEFVQAKTESIKFISKSEYKSKICSCLAKVSEFQQKIADLTLNYELEKGKIVQNYSRIKEKFELIKKKKREEMTKINSFRNTIRKTELLDKIHALPKLDESVAIALNRVKSRADEIKSSLKLVKSQVKEKKRERFILENAIDSRQLEIDDLRFKLNRKNSLKVVKSYLN